MRTHTRLGRNMLHFTKGLVVGFWGLSYFFFLQDTTAREGLGLWASGRVAKLHAGFLLFFFLSLPFFSSQLSTTPNCIAESPTVFKRNRQHWGEGGREWSCLPQSGRQHHHHSSVQTKSSSSVFFCDPFRRQDFPRIFNPIIYPQFTASLMKRLPFGNC